MACTDMAIRLEGDGLAMGSSASKKSRSLELLLTLHTVVGRHCVRRTAECSSRAHLERASRRDRWLDGRTHTPHGCAPVKVVVSAVAGPSRRRCTRTCVDLHPLPGPSIGLARCLLVVCNKASSTRI